MMRKTMILAAALAAYAAPAMAGNANHYLEQSAYYLKLARMSIETSIKVSSRKDKCIWARQALGEFDRAVEYFDRAVQADSTTPEWSAGERAKVMPFRERMMGERQRTQDYVKDRC